MLIQSLILASALIGHPSTDSALDWIKVGGSKKETIGGVVQAPELNGQPRLYVAYDNKDNEDVRLAMLTRSANGSWHNETMLVTDPKNLASQNGELLMKDLESLCRVPGQSDTLAAIGNKDKEEGWVYIFKIGTGGLWLTAELVDAFRVPDVLPDSDYEAFDLVSPDHKSMVAVWADRGTPDRPAEMWSAPFDLAKRPGSPFGNFGKTTITTPWPSLKGSRAISDLRVSLTSEIYVSSAWDPDNDYGPFDSAVYIVASLSLSDGRPTVTKYKEPIPVCYAPGYKIESIDFDVTGRKFLLGTDDENLGASIAWYER